MYSQGNLEKGVGRTNVDPLPMGIKNVIIEIKSIKNASIISPLNNKKATKGMETKTFSINFIFTKIEDEKIDFKKRVL
jgi:hypothetical protein